MIVPKLISILQQIWREANDYVSRRGKDSNSPNGVLLFLGKSLQKGNQYLIIEEQGRVKNGSYIRIFLPLSDASQNSEKDVYYNWE